MLDHIGQIPAHAARSFQDKEALAFESRSFGFKIDGLRRIKLCRRNAVAKKTQHNHRVRAGETRVGKNR